jgi:molecular chaperone GrpE (heat shock protein)
VNFTTDVVRPMQDEIQALQERVSKNEKELVVLRQFEKSQ